MNDCFFLRFVLFMFVCLFVFVAFLSFLDIFICQKSFKPHKKMFTSILKYNHYANMIDMLLSFANLTAWVQFLASSKICVDLLSSGSRKLMKNSLDWENSIRNQGVHLWPTY